MAVNPPHTVHHSHAQHSWILELASNQPELDLLLAGPLFRKYVGPLIYEYPPPDCLHPTRTVVIINILLRSRAAMYTTTAAAAVSGSLRFCWGPLFVGPLFGRTCWTCLNPPPQSAVVSTLLKQLLSRRWSPQHHSLPAAVVRDWLTQNNHWHSQWKPRGPRRSWNRSQRIQNKRK